MNESYAAKIQRLGITDEGHLSSASKRALAWPERNNNWYGQFRVSNLKGDFAYEEGVTRRDPSSILFEDGLYHTWYSRSEGPSKGFTKNFDDKTWPWDYTDVWHATSKDGITWKEQQVAVARGKAGEFDDRSVFTPEVFKHDGTYYLVYQTVKSPYIQRVKNQVGISTANSPWGPWKKHPKPILSPADNGQWLGDDPHDRFSVVNKRDFDSHKVHDPYLTFFNGKFHLYYKGEQMGWEITFGGREIRHGVATSDSPFGPYTKSPFNPISNSGHEVAIWHYDGGIGSLITTDGPERNTVQWAKDGVNFEILAHIKSAPNAMGLLRTNDHSQQPFKIFDWGLTHKYQNKDYQYIQRFDGSQPKRSITLVTYKLKCAK
ncbi:family 43 glycosylhydrolase [Paraglaciecola aquimarina]|uniref:Family 43 glycosylhydrolase n=1 Tax=Paraglaciecola algarum TaxID=3050085 RepID=A0ABS9DDY4_9ALTE|nr:family 43 glycosylhydrolase [Paraglaciecola sp. G1-23]